MKSKVCSQHSFELPHINLGGGLGIDYGQPDKNSIADFKGYFGF